MRRSAWATRPSDNCHCRTEGVSPGWAYLITLHQSQVAFIKLNDHAGKFKHEAGLVPAYPQ